MTHTLPIPVKLLISAAAVLALVGCGRKDDDRTVGQQIDSTVAQAEQRAEQAKSAAERQAAETKQDIKDAASKAGTAIEGAGAQAADKVADAGITASVNAALARDPDLSALRIDVDTSNGAVSLRGTAPNDAARDRATQIATAVKGVTRVDNQLQVRS